MHAALSMLRGAKRLQKEEPQKEEPQKEEVFNGTRAHDADLHR
jgi:hypothetical protein